MSPAFTNPTPSPPVVAPGMPFVRLELEGVGEIPMHEFLIEMKHEIYAKAELGKVTIQLFDKSMTYLEGLFIAANGKGKLQYGWLNGPLTPVRRFQTILYQPKFEAFGAFLNLTFSDYAVEKIPQYHDRSFPPSLGIQYPVVLSEMVEKIMREDGYTKFQIEETVPIEQSETDYDVAFRQQGENNHHFISTKVAPYAVSKVTGEAGYNFAIHDDTVIFRPYVKSDLIPKRVYLFARDPHGTMVSWAPQVNGTAYMVMGGGKLNAESYDPKEKKPILKEVTIDKNGSVRVKDGGGTGMQVGRQSTLSFDSEDRVAAWGKHRVTRARELAITSTATVLGDPGLSPLDYIEVYVIKSDGGYHYTSGGYFLQKVENMISKGKFETQFVCVAAPSLAASVMSGTGSGVTGGGSKSSAFDGTVQSQEAG